MFGKFYWRNKAMILQGVVNRLKNAEEHLSESHRTMAGLRQVLRDTEEQLAKAGGRTYRDAYNEQFAANAILIKENTRLRSRVHELEMAMPIGPEAIIAGLGIIHRRQSAMPTFRNVYGQQQQCQKECKDKHEQLYRLAEDMGDRWVYVYKVGVQHHVARFPKDINGLPAARQYVTFLNSLEG